MQKQTVHTFNAPKAVGPYSQGIAVTAPHTTVYFSGQIALEPATGTLVGTTAAEQTEQILKNIDALLQSQGMTAANVVKTTVFLTDMAEFAAVNAVYAGYFAAALPARSCVAVAALPLNAKVEIEIISVK